MEIRRISAANGRSDEQKSDLGGILRTRHQELEITRLRRWLVYEGGDYGTRTDAAAAFVSTNSICQGQQVPILWPMIFNTGMR